MDQSEITPDEIAWVERITGLSFADSERGTALRRLDSLDVRACPGSGKTTLLVAKLAILGARWTDRYRGICVLSHTNVARREIQAKLTRNEAYKVLQPPHFVGTIQNFVNLYLAFPAAVDIFNIRPHTVDTDRFAAAVERQLKGYEFATLRSFLERRPNQGELIRGLCFKGSELEVHPRGDAFGAQPSAKSYAQLVELKHRLARAGIFSYADMFALSEAHIKKHPVLRDALAFRFPVAFIDEMQDTDLEQWTVLEQVFKERSIIQRFGDNNQAIFRSVTAQVGVAFPDEAHVTVRDSKRLSPTIASMVGDLTPGAPEKLTGNNAHEDLQHGIILFSRESVSEVLPFFAKQVLEQVAPTHPSPVAKAVGAIGKQGDDSRHFPSSLRSYWPEYTSKQDVPTATTLSEIAQDALTESKKSCSLGDVAHAIAGGLADVLRDERVLQKNGAAWTGRGLLNALRSDYPDVFFRFAKLVAEMARKGLVNEAIQLEKAGPYYEKILAPFVDRLSKGSLTRLHEAPRADRTAAIRASRKSGDPYRYEGPEGSLDVYLSTIHAVKGETHDATLVLETYYYSHDVSRVLEHCLAPKRRGGSDGLLSQARRVYVAASRPKYLLFFAASHEKVSATTLDQIRRRGWLVHTLL